jgi:hypothetical protein
LFDTFDRFYCTCLLLANKYLEEALFINEDKNCFKYDVHYALAFGIDKDILVDCQLEVLSTIDFHLYIDFEEYKAFMEVFLSIIRSENVSQAQVIAPNVASAVSNPRAEHYFRSINA